MSAKPKVISAGGVVLREHHGQRQVLLIHRDRYQDWSLPKGKGEADEWLPETAIREIREETAVQAQLGLRLSTIRYQVAKGPKASHFWRASVIQQKPRKPDREVSAVRWFPIKEALATISYADERNLILEALDQPLTVPLLVVRHGKAMLRKNWSGPDNRRTLTGRGRRQAKELIDLLSAFGVEHLISSSALRCTQTLQPYAKAAGLEIETRDRLTEEQGSKHPHKVSKFLSKVLRNLDRPTAICGHRPILPDMFRGLGLDPHPMVVSEVTALHFDNGSLVRSETFKPKA